MDNIKLSAIARELGLSVTTVSRVINNRPDVKEETRKKVLDYIQRTGGRLVSSRSDLKLIGIVDTFKRHSLSSYYNAQILEGVDEKLFESGYITSIVHTEVIESEQHKFDNVRVLNRLHGIIWLEPVFDQHYKQIIDKHNISCVVINSCEVGLDIDLVESNSFKAAQTATEYLLGLGHRKIAFIGGQLEYRNIADRFEGYLSALRYADVEENPENIIRDLDFWNDEGGAEGIFRLFSKMEKPTAILVSSDFLLAGVYKALSQLEYSIPRDVSVISFDDSPLSRYLNPPVTSCAQPLKEMGRMAAGKLIQIINQTKTERSPSKTKVTMPFIVRDSTAPVQGDKNVQS